MPSESNVTEPNPTATTDTLPVRPDVTTSPPTDPKSSGRSETPPTGPALPGTPVNEGDQAITEIIRRGRSRPNRSARTTLVLGSLGALLFWASFPPLDWAFLAWFAPLPWLMLTRPIQRPRWCYRSLIFTASLGFLACTQWLRFGHPTMYAAWVALGIYCALYATIFVAVTRTAVHRFGVPLLVAAPILWAGLEFFRGHLITGFAWYFLGHTQYAWTTLIQLCDTFGVYGLSALLMSVAVGLTMLLPDRLYHRFHLIGEDESIPTASRRRFLASVITPLVLVSAALGYGGLRRAEYRNLTVEKERPVFALLQGDFDSTVGPDADPQLQARTYHWLAGQATPYAPDVIVWPESAYPSRLHEKTATTTEEDLIVAAPQVPSEYWIDDPVAGAFGEFAAGADAAMVIGTNAVRVDGTEISVFNSAAFATPQAETVVSRYDKIHRVPFGEYVPLRDELPFLQVFSPYSASFGLTAGTHYADFRYGPWTMGAVICYEDTVPHLVRSMVRSAEKTDRPIDVMVNLTNDGWFHPKSEFDAKIGSSSSEQHLITSMFRAVETRTPLVRSVNTGVSAMIDGEGTILEPDTMLDLDRGEAVTMRDAEVGGFRKRFRGILVSEVPLDPRVSPYVRYGEWFAQLCAVAVLLVIACAFGFRLRDRLRDRDRVAAVA